MSDKDATTKQQTHQHIYKTKQKQTIYYVTLKTHNLLERTTIEMRVSQKRTLATIHVTKNSKTCIAIHHNEWYHTDVT